ncbi:MAG: uridine phosphorylase [Oscillospiraceae bacterium]|nr:uridine phosphorylase [Oscillospiraceae bacterium]
MPKMYHIDFDESHGARYAILPGDPGRVEKIAAYLENPRFFHRNREYTAWIGEIEGESVMVMSTGMGGPSTAIAVEELYQTGIRNFIRVGTCGGMAEQVAGGDIVIATGAIRMEGTTREYVPLEFPAVAHIDAVNALIQAAKNLGFSWHAGIVHCKDSFYGQHSPDRMPAGCELTDKWRAWIMAGALASEMESAALYITSQILGARAGCVCSVIWNQERERRGLPNPHVRDSTDAIKTAVESVRLMIRQEHR